MLAENLADTTSAQEPQGILLLPPVPKDGANGDGGVASEEVGGGEGDGSEGAVRMEMEGGVDVDFMVEDGEEQVSMGKCFSGFVTVVMNVKLVVELVINVSKCVSEARCLEF